jgi:putative hydrolase of the HAD superfamily
MPLLMCDLDDTLVVRPPLFREWAQEFLAEVGQSPELVDWVVEQDRGGHRPRLELFSALTKLTGHHLTSEELLEDHQRRLAGSYRLTDDTRGALDDARARGWTIAVVTNGPTAVQTRKLEATGLDAIVDAVVISQELGVAKPDPLIFRTAAERAGTTLEGAWMLGDNLDADIAGAQAVGARSVWVKREWNWLTYTSGAEPDLVAESFADAVRLVLEATG